MDEFLMDAEDVLMDDEAEEVEISAAELLEDEGRAIDDIAEITDEDIENCSLDDIKDEYLSDVEDETDDYDDNEDIIYTSSEEEEETDDSNAEEDILNVLHDEDEED